MFWLFLKRDLLRENRHILVKVIFRPQSVGVKSEKFAVYSTDQFDFMLQQI